MRPAATRRTFRSVWDQFGRLSNLPAQSLLWQRGDACDEVILIVQGELEVFHQNLEGEVAVVRCLGPGEILGEMSALDGGKHSATVRSRTSCQLRRIPASEFRRALEGRLDLVHDLLARQNERVRHLTRQVAVLGFESVATRIARHLTRDLPAQETYQLTHRDLAERVAATRESVTKALGLLARQGFLELGRGTVTVIDRNGLGSLAGEDD